MSFLNLLTRRRHARDATEVLLSATMEIEPTCDAETSKAVMTSQKNSISFPALLLTATGTERSNSPNNVNLSRALYFQTEDTDAAFMAKQTYTIGVSDGKSVKAMNIVVARLGTRAGDNPIYVALITPG